MSAAEEDIASNGKDVSAPEEGKSPTRDDKEGNPQIKSQQHHEEQERMRSVLLALHTVAMDEVRHKKASLIHKYSGVKH